MAQNSLGTASCVNILVGGMIGSAIFSLSGLTMLNAGPASMITWLIAGFLMLAYGLLMAELASSYPISGGAYVFPRLAFGGKKGKALGWMSCWCCILTNFAAIAFSAIYVGTYLSVAFPWASELQVPLALAVIALCVVLNCIDFSTTGRINTCIVLLLIVSMAIYIINAFTSPTYDTSYLTPVFTQGIGGKAGFLSSVPTAIIGYSSISAIAFIVSEVRDPKRTVPRSMFISIVIVIAIYILMILATLGHVNVAFLNENPGFQYIPMFAVCFTKFPTFPLMAKALSIAATLALMTTMLVCTSINARIIHAAAQDGFFPKAFSKLNRFEVPHMGTVVTGLVSAFIAAKPSLTSTIVDFGSLFNCITISLTILALMKTRLKEKRLSGLVLPSLILLILLVCNLSQMNGIGIWIYTAVSIAVGLLIFLFTQRS